MARGESATPGRRGPGAAIWAGFGVVCLAALCCVLWTTHWIEGCASYRGLMAFLGGPVPTASEPFAGAYATLSRLSWRSCVQDDPALAAAGVTSAQQRARVSALLEARGYIAQADWSAPGTLPLRGAHAIGDASCGVVAVVAETGSIIAEARGAGATSEPACVSYAIIAGVCSDRADTLEIAGTGAASTRAFVLPGLTPEIVLGTGLPADVVLAHLEAEAELRSRGWQASDDVVRSDVAGTGHSSTTSLTPPREPRRGCVAWVAVGDGVGGANVSWGTLGMTSGVAQSRFVTGLVSCDPRHPPPAGAGGMRVDFADAEGDGGAVYFRAFAPHVGPTLPGGAAHAAITGTTSMRLVEASAARLPRAVPVLRTPPK